MNYYNYPMNNMFPQYTPPPPQQQLAPAGLNGRVVEGIEVVRAAEVPFGGYGVFPKADLSEIYVKVWNNNGTTNTITFIPTAQPNKSTSEEMLFQKLTALENKLDEILKFK